MGEGVYDVRDKRIQNIGISHIDGEFAARHYGRQKAVRRGDVTQDGAVRKAYDVIRAPQSHSFILPGHGTTFFD